MKRNTLYSAIKMTIAGAVLGSLAACGGGSDSGTSTAGSNGSSMGPVSGFGSVYVNGTHFQINNAQYRGDDGIERETQLEKGMILKVTGTWGRDGEGEAQYIYYDDTLRGPVDSITWDEPTKTGVIVLANQNIAINNRTVFKGATPVELKAGVESTTDDYHVRISGYRLANGEFQASFVGVMDANTPWPYGRYEVEVEGAVSNLGVDTFEINGLVVNYQSATFEDGAAEDLADGVIVEVEGKLENGKLTAFEIEFEDDMFEENEDVEISGAITSAYDSETGQFYLNGTLIQLTDDTDFDDDITAEQLTEGAEIKVEGEYRNGIIVAEEIETRDGDAQLSGFIESIEQGGEVLMVSGVRVTLTDSTLIEDEDTGDAQESVVMRTQDLESLSVNDYLEIEGRQTAENGGGLIAFYIERDDGDELELEGKISSLTDTTVTVMGLELQAEIDLSGFQVGNEVEVEFKKVSGEYRIVTIQADD